MVHTDPWACLLAALMLLTLPLDWLVGAAAAAAVHEFCHILAVRLTGGKLLSLDLKPGGAVIRAEIPTTTREFLCTLAGPLGSFFLYLLRFRFPKLAVCGLFQGMFNLIPVYPLDGGRMVKLLLDSLCPDRADIWLRRTEWTAAIALGTCWILLCRYLQWGPGTALLAGLWIIPLYKRKIPCKRGRNRVQ